MGNKKKNALALSLVILTSGCSTIDSHTRVPDWPELKVIEHHVSHREMNDRCAPYTAFLMQPLGCTLFMFDIREAHIYVSKELPLNWVLEHERLHAAGYDHIGSSAMKRLWDGWKAKYPEVRTVAETSA